jgi:hypothetical protein
MPKWMKVALVLNALVALSIPAVPVVIDEYQHYKVITAFLCALASAWIWFAAWGIRVLARKVLAPLEPAKPPSFPKLSEEKANKWVKTALGYGLFVTCATFLAATFATFADSSNPIVTIAGLSPWMFIDAILYGGLLYGLYRTNRVAAVCLFALQTVEAINTMESAQPGQSGARWAFAIFIAFWLYRGMRGTFALVRWGKVRAAGLMPVPASETPQPEQREVFNPGI